MAESKTPTKKKPAAQAEPSPPTEGSTPAVPLTRVDTVLQALLAKAASITNDEREVLFAKYSVQQCEAKGAATKSEGVLSESVGWAVSLEKSLSAHPTLLRRYPAKRFAWFLECIQALAAARALHVTQGGTAGLLKKAVEQAQKAALAARTELVESLDELVEGDAGEENALSAALGSTDKPDRIVDSIRSVCAYAQQWLDRKDAASMKRVELSGLTPAEVQAAQNAGRALAQATAGKTLDGAALTRDSPAVNQAEGRVLMEMRAAQRVVNRANARNHAIKKLVPGAATRSVLVSRSKKAAAPAADTAPPAPSPADAKAPSPS